MLGKITSMLCSTIHHPSVISFWLREQFDRSSIKRRIKADQVFLEEKNVWPLLVAGSNTEIPPDASDLANLYRLIAERRPRVVLEFGVGYSSLVICAALRANLAKANVRGHLYVVDSEKKWIENTRNKFESDLLEFISFQYSPISVKVFDNTLCHTYDSLPDVSPNFVYVDGPSGASGEEEISGEINGLGFTGGRPVVGADVLLYESSAPLDFFILVDGRWETCRFLGTHLRNKYRHRRFVARKFQTFQYIGKLMAW